MRRAVSIAALCAGLGLASYAAALPPAETPVVTEHRVTVAGKPLSYTAEAGRIAIRDAETGEPHGWMYYTAYRVPSPGKPRPLAFVWNGGPGANSSTLHFEVAGPRIAEGDGLAPNPDTWLANADLVFVDPIGTGFSRPTKAEYASEFYGTRGDVASVTEFVRAWRLTHGAEASPLYLIGESWGAGRAASVAYALLKRGVPVDGLVLISGGAGLSSATEGPSAAPYKVVGYAVAAHHHGKLAPDVGPSAEAVRAAAVSWVREIYAPALAAPASLTADQREAVAAGLARFTGVPLDKIDRKSLIVTPRQFRTTLVPGQTLNVFDMRIGQEAGGPSKAAVLGYLRADELGYRTALPYVGLEALEDAYLPDGKPPQGVGARWDYATADVTPEERQAAFAEAVRTGAGPPKLGPPLPGTAEALAINPKLRVLVASGLYDSLANCAGDEIVAAQLSEPLRAAVTFRCYGGGHMMYRDAPARRQLNQDIRDLIIGH